MKVKPLSLSSLHTVPLSQRKKDCEEHDFGAPYRAGGSFADFLCSLPNVGGSADLFALRDAILSALRHNKPVILGCGGHVMDSGLSPMLARLIENKMISAVALTGAAVLQDVEIALTGHTLAYAEHELQHGHFSITEETGRLISEAINMGSEENWGIGRSIGQKMLDAELPHLEHSLIATASRYGVPVTVHPAIGADAFNLYPQAHGEALGAAGMYDFRLLAGVMAEASGGVVLNVASGMVLPRIFMQAAGAVRNVGKQLENLTVAVIDSAADTKMTEEVLARLTQKSGTAYRLHGQDELLLPLLFASVLDAMG